MVDFITGMLQIANVFLAVVAGVIASTIFKVSKKKLLKAWRPLVIVLILFAVEEIVGSLKSFGIFSTPYLTHIIPSFILGFLIWSLVRQINISRGDV